MIKISLVTTTINYPKLLLEYAKDFSKNNKKENLELLIIIAGDKKTPDKTKQLAKNITKKYKINCEYLDEKKQNEFLRNFKNLKSFLPWNSVQRRNVAILKSLQEKSDLIVTIDDDNFLKTTNFIQSHLFNIKKTRGKIVNSSSNWFNICQFLNENSNNNFFHRGFPISKKKLKNNFQLSKQKNFKVAANAGLWLNDPDVDAITRLSQKIKVNSYKLNENFHLGPKVWSPFNSQNTALIAESIPAYFLSPHVGRMDDIYASYIYKKICDHLKFYISYGFPLVRQDRNDHNIWNDLDLEKKYHYYLEDFLTILEKIKIDKKNKTFYSSTVDLIDKINSEINKKKFETEKLNCFKSLIKGYKIWLQSIKKIK